MADTYEKDLAQKSSLTTSDFIRVVGSDNVSYKNALSSFPTSGTNTIVTAGSTDEETLHNYIDSLPNESQMHTKSLYASGYGTRMVIIQKYTNGNYASALEWGYLDTQPIKYHRKVNGTWVVDTLPTRAEVDALNSKTTWDITFNSSYALGSGYVQRYGKICVLSATVKILTTGTNMVCAYVVNGNTNNAPNVSVWCSCDLYYGASRQAEARVASNGELQVSAPGGMENSDLKIFCTWIAKS